MSTLVRVGCLTLRAQCVLLTEVPAWSATRRKSLAGVMATGQVGDEDARVLVPEYGGGAPDQPERYRSLENVFRYCGPQGFLGFPIPNPRTAHYYGKEVLKQGPSFIARHRIWKTENRLGDEDAGVTDHSAFCEALDCLYCYDQLDGTNLASVERIC